MACSHIATFFENISNKLAVKNLICAIIFPTTKKGLELKTTFSCKKCSELKVQFSDAMICAHCIFSGCTKNGHIRDHFVDKNHPICISLELGEFFCNICRDYQYHEYSDNIIRENRKRYFANFSMFDLCWRPEIQDLHLLHYVSPVTDLDNLASSTRGLINMGNTCFLNVVIQALTHTPALRDFLLSDLHRCPTLIKSKDCLACEMIRITQEIYKPSIQPYAMTNLLQLIWTKFKHLAGYNQNDAHELFLAILSELHTHLNDSEKTFIPVKSNENKDVLSSEVRASSDPSSSQDTVNFSSHSSSTGHEEDCECIIHQAFMATLESTIIYDCGVHISRRLEIFRDLSLEIKREGTVTLETSFRSYFGTERMKDALCSTCMKLGATKQYSLFHLPNIFSVHLKRCHATSKVTTKIQFPEELDLAPFISNKKMEKSLWENKYSLYSVINHRGQSHSGHYTAYVRTEGDRWCLCDDQTINLVPVSEVLLSDAYMLFYHKNSLVMKSN